MMNNAQDLCVLIQELGHLGAFRPENTQLHVLRLGTYT